MDGDEMDRENVINGLESQLEDLKKYANKDQPLSLTQEQAQEIIALLKEQEAVEPIPYHRSDGTIFKYECRKCRTKIFNMDLFCRRCGHPIDWSWK